MTDLMILIDPLIYHYQEAIIKSLLKILFILKSNLVKIKIGFKIDYNSLDRDITENPGSVNDFLHRLEKSEEVPHPKKYKVLTL